MRHSIPIGRGAALAALLLGTSQCAWTQTAPPVDGQGELRAPHQGPRDASAALPLQAPLRDDAYGGVVINQTITLVGHDFYRAFVAAWRDRPLSERFTLTVGERPSPRFGSQVWVEFGRRRVFQSFLPPARVRIAAIGTQAAELAYENVVDSEAQRLLFRDPDLGHDEI